MPRIMYVYLITIPLLAFRKRWEWCSWYGSHIFTHSMIHLLCFLKFRWNNNCHCISVSLSSILCLCCLIFFAMKDYHFILLSWISISKSCTHIKYYIKITLLFLNRKNFPWWLFWYILLSGLAIFNEYINDPRHFSLRKFIKILNNFM